MVPCWPRLGARGCKIVCSGLSWAFILGRLDVLWFYLRFAFALPRGTSRGNLEGNLKGNLEGNLEGHHEGNLEGKLEGNPEGNLQGNLEGNLKEI
mgnify:FL=1